MTVIVSPDDAPPPELVVRLVAEERLRLDIARSLTGGEEPRAKRGAIWTFLNSSFGLFLLSSVVIAGLSHLYTDHEQKLKQTEAKRVEVQKLVSEIDYRISQLDFLARQLARRDLTDKERQSNGIFVWRIVTGDVMFQPAWPDLKNVHLYGVMSRLKLVAGVPIGEDVFQSILEIENGRDRTWHYQKNDLDRLTGSLRKYRRALPAAWLRAQG
jgi:hypothetical protein